MRDLHIFRHSGLLGTLIDVRIGCVPPDDMGDVADADLVDLAVIDEITRLEQIFSVHTDDSVLARWRRGDSTSAPDEFAELMAMTLDWQRRSDGRFNPMVGELTKLWQRAEIDGALPDERELRHVARAIAEPRFEMADGKPRAIADCSNISLDAIAKGFIVDRAIDVAHTSSSFDRRGWVAVNAGGDVAHRGQGEIVIGIENPHRPYDNEPPLTTIALENTAVATSGLARRGFRIGDAWYGHVLDPATGFPVDQIASISVVAPTAALADVIATSAGVLDPARAIDFVDTVEGADALVIDRDRRHWQTEGWQELVVSPA